MSFISQHQIITKKIDYVRTARGWRGTFRGPFVVSKDAEDLESCRRDLLTAVDERIVAWLSETPAPARERARTRAGTRARQRMTTAAG